MTTPTIPTVAGGRVLTAVQADTTGARTFPSLSGLTKNSGDLLIAICIAYQSTAAGGFSAWGAGFTEFKDLGSTTNTVIGMAYKWSTGLETGTFTVTEGATITGHAVMILLSIPAAHLTSPPEAAALAVGTTAFSASPALTPSWGAEDTLWIAIGSDAETATTGSFDGLTAGPSAWTDVALTGISADVVGGIQGGVAFHGENIASLAAPAWTGDVSQARNAATVLGIRPAVTGSPVKPANFFPLL